MKVTIEINTDSAAFDGCNAGNEVARILRKEISRLEDWNGMNEWEISLRDINGNKVGALEVTK